MKKLLFFLLVLLLLSANPVFALEIAYPPIPGVDKTPKECLELPSEEKLGCYLKYFYYLFLMIAGTIALTVIVYGGVKYLISGGNVTKMKDARDQISAGVLGLLFLFCSYIVITTINPQLALFYVEEPKRAYGVRFYDAEGNSKTVSGDISDLEAYWGPNFHPTSLKFFSLEKREIAKGREFLAAVYPGPRIEWVEQEWEDDTTKIKGLMTTIYEEKDFDGDNKSYSKNTYSFLFEPKSVTLGFKPAGTPEEAPITYVEIPLGWLIDRVKAKSEVARDQAEDVYVVGAEQDIKTHTSLKELAECLDLLTKECKCDRVTEDSPLTSDCSPYSDDPNGACVGGACREPCDRCVAKNICHSLDGFHLDSTFADICVGLPEPEEPLLACPGQCNLRTVLEAKQAEFETLTQQLWEERADAERARIALKKEKQTLEIAESLMRMSWDSPISLYQLWPRIEEIEIKKLRGFEHIEAVRVSRVAEKDGVALAPPLFCRVDLPDYERTPFCLYCPCDPAQDYGCTPENRYQILFCEMFKHIGHDNPETPQIECETEQTILDSSDDILGGSKWFGPGDFSGPQIRYNGGTYTVPTGGVGVCVTTCNGRCSGEGGGASTLGVPDRLEYDPANFYIKEEGNEDYIKMIEHALASIWGIGYGPGPAPGIPGAYCDPETLNRFTSDWNEFKAGLSQDHWNTVRKASEDTGVRQALILALISRESGFNRTAGFSNSYCCGRCPPGCLLPNCQGYLGCHDGRCGSCPDCLNDLYGNCGAFDMLWEAFNESWRADPELRFNTKDDVHFSRCGIYLGVPHCGGAMGLAQAMPSTWQDIYSGGTWQYKDPWNLEHAYMFAAIHLKERGGAHEGTCLAERVAVHRYIGGNPEDTATAAHAACIVQLADYIANNDTGEDVCETGSKLTIFTSFLGPKSMEFIERAHPRVVKIFNNFGYATEVKERSPETIIIGRKFLEPQPDDVNEWWDKVKEDVLNHPEIDYWEGTNEPDIDTREEMREYAQFEKERVEKLAMMGRKACIGNFPEGTPDIALWSEFSPALEVAAANRGILGLHEYGAPTMEGTPGREWHVGRYRKYDIPIPLVITECGIDGGVIGEGGKGWKSYVSADEYLEDLKWYDRLLAEDSYVWGATVFALEIPGWDNFDIAEIADDLASYVAGE